MDAHQGESFTPRVALVISIGLAMAIASITASLELSAQERNAAGAVYSSKRMADGKEWMIRNVDSKTEPSYCYGDADANCRRYGRLYTWESARRVCESLRDGWRLPTDDEWRQLAKHYGGVSEDADKNALMRYPHVGSDRARDEEGPILDC